MACILFSTFAFNLSWPSDLVHRTQVLKFKSSGCWFESQVTTLDVYSQGSWDGLRNKINGPVSRGATWALLSGKFEGNKKSHFYMYYYMYCTCSCLISSSNLISNPCIAALNRFKLDHSSWNCCLLSSQADHEVGEFSDHDKDKGVSIKSGKGSPIVLVKRSSSESWDMEEILSFLLYLKEVLKNKRNVSRLIWNERVLEKNICYYLFTMQTSMSKPQFILPANLIAIWIWTSQPCFCCKCFAGFEHIPTDANCLLWICDIKILFRTRRKYGPGFMGEEASCRLICALNSFLLFDSADSPLLSPAANRTESSNFQSNESAPPVVLEEESGVRKKVSSLHVVLQQVYTEHSIPKLSKLSKRGRCTLYAALTLANILPNMNIWISRWICPKTGLGSEYFHLGLTHRSS